MLKILFRNISHTNRKQNQLSKFVFAQTVVLKIRKSDDFRELYENEPEMAAPRLETNIDICDVMFGELVFMTIRDSEAFEKSSSLFQGFLKFID